MTEPCFTSNVWEQTHHKDGDKIRLIQRSPSQRFWSFAEDVLLEADHHVFRGTLGGNGPAFLWKIPVGKRKYYEDDDDLDTLKNSVNSLLYDRFNKTLQWLNKHNHGKVVADLDITPELAAELWPDMSWLIMDNDDL